MRRNLTATLIVVAAIVMTGLPSGSYQARAVQETDPDIVSALTMINTYRSWLGIPPLVVEPHLQKAAEAHVEYYRLNYGDPALAGMGLHYETEGKPGFTGVDFQERAAKAGYDGWVNENAGLSGSMVRSTEWFIGTVGHRLTLLDPRYVHVGMAAINQDGIRFEIIDLGAPKWIEDTAPEWVAWPPAGATGVDLGFYGEAPDPFPGATYPVGYPISLKYFGPGELTLTTATLSTGGVTVPAFAEIGTGWLSRETILLCAEDPLEPGTTYQVHIEGTANGSSFVKEWSFTTTTGSDALALDGESPIVSVPETPVDSPVSVGPLPAGVGRTHPVIQALWSETDGPIARGEVDRSWLWGPDTWLDIDEPSAESPGGLRQVYYFDKARMEVNQLSDGTGGVFITAGLLVRDMIVGLIQVGEAQFVPTSPAGVPLAGDPLPFNPDAPTYASLTSIASVEPGRPGASQRAGEPIVEVLAKDGTIYTNHELGTLATYGSYEATLGHNIAAVFDEYMTTLPTDWHMSVGLPLAEPYWVRANVAGIPTWVLVQVFERRILTYTPDNPAGWQVEMGNIGRHYYTWRYGTEPPR